MLQTGVMKWAEVTLKKDDILQYPILKFFVMGEPAPQGSTKSFKINSKDPKTKKFRERIVTTHGNRNTEKWRQRIATEAQAAMADWQYLDDRNFGYKVIIDFYFTKPASARKKKLINNKRPDLDKLIRAVLDGITNILIPDDALVVSIEAKKHYVLAAGQHPGLDITIIRFPDTESIPGN